MTPVPVLYILTWKCASRHNGVHFFDISTAKSCLELVCFVHFDSEMCFAPQRRAIFHLSSGQLAPHPPLWRAYFSTIRSLGKHSVSRLSYLFTHLHHLSSYSFSSTLLSSDLSLLSASSLLCFTSVHIVGSLTSKLPSNAILFCIKFYYTYYILCNRHIVDIYIYIYIYIYMIYVYVSIYISYIYIIHI